MTTAKPEEPPAIAPWWRQAYCWLVIAGPLAVVIASVITGVIVYRGADTMSAVYISEHRHRDTRLANSVLPAEAVSKGAVKR